MLKFNFLCRLLINLTIPVSALFNDEIPTEKLPRTYFEKMVVHLQEYKTAMADESLWLVVKKKLQNLLLIVTKNFFFYIEKYYFFDFKITQESIERGEENEMTIERILTLIRNVMRIAPSQYEKRTNYDTTVHDEVYIKSSNNKHSYPTEFKFILISGIICNEFIRNYGVIGLHC